MVYDYLCMSVEVNIKITVVGCILINEMIENLHSYIRDITFNGDWLQTVDISLRSCSFGREKPAHSSLNIQR